MAIIKSKKILLKLDKVISDRNQYKPYIAELSGQNIFVEIEVPLEEIRGEGKEVILTINGLSSVMNSVATSLEEMHEEYRRKKFGH